MTTSQPSPPEPRARGFMEPPTDEPSNVQEHVIALITAAQGAADGGFHALPVAIGITNPGGPTALFRYHIEVQDIRTGPVVVLNCLSEWQPETESGPVPTHL